MSSLGSPRSPTRSAAAASCLLVHAESSPARDFCLRLVPEFEESPTDELHLVLMLKGIRRTLGL